MLPQSLVLGAILLSNFCLSTPQQVSKPHHLNITAVVDAEDGFAEFECWQLTAPFNTYPTVGTALSLGDVSNMTYVVLPPRSEEGIHRPPHPM